MKTIYCFVLIFIFFDLKLSDGLSCKDENDENVDWFIIYKLPKVQGDPSPYVSKGSAYAYITSSGSEMWKLSSHGIQDESSMLGKTWQELKRNEKSVTYLFYNDEAPKPYTGTANGHMKGFFAFDDSSGYWVMHSIPTLGKISDYNYPYTGLKFGQYAFCVNYDTSQLDSICNHLLYGNPNIYESKTTENVLSSLGETAKTIFTDKPTFIHSPPFLRTSKIKSVGQQVFMTFAKDNQLVQDIYSEIIAPSLKTSLMTETWRRVKKNYQPSACDGDFTVTDVNAVNLTASDESGKKKSTYFDSSDDHSKWAVSLDSQDNWFCFSDLNRMKSQEKRGGGAVCFQYNSVWKQFKSIVAESDKCPVS